MKKVLFFALSILVLTACSKDDVDQAAIDEEIITTYLEDNDISAERDASGLYYRIINKGSGKFSSSANLEIRYTGKLMENGNIFDSGTIVGPLSRYISGWQIGVPKIETGGTIVLYIPSGLAYGENGAGSSIPPNAVLIFVVDVLSVK